jgi:hypothetical protein
LVFITREKGIQTLFENCFEILEKEKKIEIFFFSIFWPEAKEPSSSPRLRAAHWAGPTCRSCRPPRPFPSLSG